MSGRKTTVTPVSRVCGEAVERYVAELAARTPLRPRVVAQEAEVVFDESDEAAICVDWAAEGQVAAGAPAEDGWDDDGAAGDAGDPGGDPAADRLIAHFERTIEALADNPQAARAFLANIDENEERGGRTLTAASPQSEKGAEGPRRLHSRGQAGFAGRKDGGKC